MLVYKTSRGMFYSENEAFVLQNTTTTRKWSKRGACQKKKKIENVPGTVMFRRGNGPSRGKCEKKTFGKAMEGGFRGLGEGSTPICTRIMFLALVLTELLHYWLQGVSFSETNRQPTPTSESHPLQPFNYEL